MCAPVYIRMQVRRSSAACESRDGGEQRRMAPIPAAEDDNAPCKHRVTARPAAAVHKTSACMRVCTSACMLHCSGGPEAGAGEAKVPSAKPAIASPQSPSRRRIRVTAVFRVAAENECLPSLAAVSDSPAAKPDGFASSDAGARRQRSDIPIGAQWRSAAPLGALGMVQSSCRGPK
jgi:hypothetical protein